MGQNTEENDAQKIAENLMENILNEVTRSITERADSCFDSFESLKLQTFGSEDILNYGCSRRESCGKAKEYECSQDNANVKDLCYPSLANLPEVCVHRSSMSKTSKQGEGDYQQAIIRETTAFYRLETGAEEDRPSGSKDYDRFCGSSSLVEPLHEDAAQLDTVEHKHSLETEEGGLNESKDRKNSWASSLTTENSHDELVEDLQRSINSVSINDIHLSDYDDCSGSNTPFDSCARGPDGCVCLFDDRNVLQDDTKRSDDCPDKQACLHQSRKFCQFNNVHFFPREEPPPNYCQLVNESYDKYDSITKDAEDEQMLLSDASSEELVIIECDEIDKAIADDCYSQANNFNSPYLSSLAPCSSRGPGTSRTSVEPSDRENRITVVADVEPTTDRGNWEEALEVQVSVTEPMKQTEQEEDNEDCDFVKTRKYWTSVGLVTERTVDPKYATFLNDDSHGIETVPGVPRVRETRVKRTLQDPDEILKVDEATERDKSQTLDRNFGGQGKIKCEKPPKYAYEEVSTQNYCIELEPAGENVSGDTKVNYLNFSKEAASGGKKKSLVARLTRSLSNIFRAKKKNKI